LPSGIKGGGFAFTPTGVKYIQLPVYCMKKKENGCEIKGSSDAHKIKIYISSGETCSDGMSDRSYSDTVKVEASDDGTLNGCGGTITEGADGPPWDLFSCLIANFAVILDQHVGDLVTIAG